MALTAFEHSLSLSDAARMHGQVLSTAGSVLERGIGEVVISDVYLASNVSTAKMEVQPYTRACVGIVAGDFNDMNRRSFQLRTRDVNEQAHVQIFGPDIVTFDDEVADIQSDDRVNNRVWSASDDTENDAFIVSPDGWRQVLGHTVSHAGSIALRATRPCELKVNVPHHSIDGGIPNAPGGVRVSATDVENMERVRFRLGVNGLLAMARVEVECYRRGEYSHIRDTAVIRNSENILRWQRISRIGGKVDRADYFNGAEQRFDLGEIKRIADKVARFARGEIRADRVLTARP